jgi:beta-phosphoglucomutase family hydrolase
MNEPCAIIWDVDGTLVDTAELHFQAWARLAGEVGRPFSREDFAATFGRRNPEIIRYLFRHEFTDAEVLEIGERKENYYRGEAEKGVELLPGVRELLSGLHARGVRQAVGSSAPRGNLDLILRITNSRQYFEAIVSAEDTQRGKPDPQVFLVAAEKLGVRPQRCIVFEDAVAGVQAAKAGGMKCVAVTFVGHHSEDKLKAAGADWVVKSFTEVTPDPVLALLH